MLVGMLVGLISDIHSNIYGLQAVLSAIREAKIDLIICAGDIIGYYPFVNETIDLLRKEKIVCIMGNHDAALAGQLIVDETLWQQYSLDYTNKVISADNLDWLCQLPHTLSLELEGLAVQVYHGSPWLPLTEYIYPDHDRFERFGDMTADYVVLGHTHWPLLKKVSKVTVVNPGSCGQPRDYKPGGCYAILNTEKRQVSFYRVAYDLRRVTDVLQKLNFNSKLIEILYRTETKCL